MPIARGVYSLRDSEMLERFAGFEYKACCWRLRAVARRSISNREGTQETSFYVQLELNGLASVGNCRRFPGTRNSRILAGNFRPVKNNSMIFKAFSRACLVLLLRRRRLRSLRPDP